MLVHLHNTEVQHVDSDGLLLPVDGVGCKLGSGAASGIRAALPDEDRMDELRDLEDRLNRLRSKLATHERGTFLNLYVVLDLFSRYVVAWMVAARENSALAKQLFAESIGRYGIDAGQLIVHQDRGAPMTSHGFADLLGELGVERSYSRPRVSNDNPYSESHFRTAKYQPDYPGRFLDIAHARRWCDEFFQWYNARHHHTGLALFTPHDVFFGNVDAIAECREQALNDAYLAHPERFVAGPPRVQRPPARVYINPADGEPPTAQRVLDTDDGKLVDLWPTPPTTPLVINLPAAPSEELAN